MANVVCTVEDERERALKVPTSSSSLHLTLAFTKLGVELSALPVSFGFERLAFSSSPPATSCRGSCLAYHVSGLALLSRLSAFLHLRRLLCSLA